MRRCARIGLVLLLFQVVGVGCDPKAPAGSGESRATVAVVDGAPIYARDYVLNFEFGYPHLYPSGNPRLAYLNRMIDEKLLAQEGMRRGLLNHPGIRQSIRDLRDELLVGQVFQRYVNDSVTVAERDIMMAMQEEHTSFRLRYLPAPTRLIALRMRKEAQEVGLAVATQSFLSRNERGLTPSDFESGYVRYHELPPDLMAAIIDLPVGEISAPVSFRGQFLLLEVIEVRREPVSMSGAERQAAEQVVFNRQAKARAGDFIDAMMRPLGVRVKSAPYRMLRELLWQLYPRLTPHHNLLDALLEVNIADSLRLDETLITTSRGDWTVREFLAGFPAARYPLRHGTRSAFENDLYDAIGLTLRDHFFVKRALAEGMDKDSLLRHELALWTDKWVYRALRNELGDNRESVPETVLRLRERYPIIIHHSVLDTLSLSPPGGAGLTVLKGHTLRPAFPVLDPD
ncbi:MAG: hypothetical protein OXU68_06105 [Bacteroidota bacterium]|nr:hypothetical protein [Bacteroidota bacterium]